MPALDILPGRARRDTETRTAAFAQPRRWPRRHWLATTLLAAGLALVLAAGLLAIWQPWHKCGRGMTAVGSPYQCVGLNLDSGPFQANDPLSALERKIAEYNARVISSGGPYGTVVLLEAMTRDLATDTDSVQSLKNDIEGAFTAVWRANNSEAVGPRTMFNVRLLLANTGAGNAYWRSAVDAVKLYAAAEHIVAVTGIGVSTEQTRAAVAALGSDPDRSIATVGSLVTADDMTHDQGMPNFFRVAPTNSDEVRVAVHYILNKIHPRSILLVKDTNRDDSYTSTLQKSFTDLWRKSSKTPLRTIAYSSKYGASTGGSDRDTVISSLFAPNAAQICDSHPDVIYFAGRGGDIHAFLKALSDHPCTSLTPTTLVSGDDANNLVKMPQPRVVKEIVYTGLAAPNQWSHAGGPASEAYNQFAGAFTDSLRFHATDLDDGNAIMNYDAALVAITAARTSTISLSTPGTVVQYLALICGPKSITGASGKIDLSPGTGNPTDKPMPLLHIDSSGSQTLIRMQQPNQNAKPGADG